MNRTRANAQPVIIVVGFAAGPGGSGVAYAKLRTSDPAAESIVRVGFRCRPLAALRGRDVAYAALAAVAGEALRRGERDVEIRLDDTELVLDLSARRGLPATLTVPYVTLRCTLNRFARAAVVPAGDEARDLTARARAEASLFASSVIAA